MSDQDQTFVDNLMEEAYRPPLWVALVFVVTMLAIYFMGRGLTTQYELPILPQSVESVG
jgi:hypothetical protein